MCVVVVCEKRRVVCGSLIEVVEEKLAFFTVVKHVCCLNGARSSKVDSITFYSYSSISISTFITCVELSFTLK